MSFIYCHLNFHANLLRPWRFPLTTKNRGKHDNYLLIQPVRFRVLIQPVRFMVLNFHPVRFMVLNFHPDAVLSTRKQDMSEVILQILSSLCLPCLLNKVEFVLFAN
jgi:hypothetical protein